MTRIVFVHPDASTTEVEAKNGQSLMSAAVDNGIDEIAAECGGACACGTCHCYIEPDGTSALGPPTPMERDMIECVIDPTEQSRLSCQITVTDKLDGLVVRVPGTQY